MINFFFKMWSIIAFGDEDWMHGRKLWEVELSFLLGHRVSSISLKSVFVRDIVWVDIGVRWGHRRLSKIAKTLFLWNWELLWRFCDWLVRFRYGGAVAIVDSGPWWALAQVRRFLPAVRYGALFVTICSKATIFELRSELNLSWDWAQVLCIIDWPWGCLIFFLQFQGPALTRRYWIATLRVVEGQIVVLVWDIFPLVSKFRFHSNKSLRFRKLKL